MADLPPLPRPNSRGLDALPGSQGMPQALPRVLDVIAALIGAPTEGEGSQMEDGSQAFQSAFAGGDRQGMAQALGEQAGVMAPYMAGAGTFAGVGAKTADLVRLASAEAMEQAGKSADDIWRATGWGRGADGKWRFEIDDSEAWLESPLSAPPGNYALNHEDLSAAYPEMWGKTQQSIKRGPSQNGLKAYFDTVNDAVVVRGDGQHKSSALHEFQHAVQKEEGFNRGTTPSGAAHDQSKDLIDERNALYRKINESGALQEADAFSNSREARQLTGAQARERYRKIASKLNSDDVARYFKLTDAIESAQSEGFDIYRRFAGETEARNVQTRMNMNAQERLQTPPWATEDVPRDQQIVRRR